MQTPYEILGLDEIDADDATIKKAYLAKVREFPPEQQGEAFRIIREAYELIATDKQRRQYRLFHVRLPDVSLLLGHVNLTGQPERPAAETLMAALTESVMTHLAQSSSTT